MPISMTRYVDITSGVGGADQVPQRQLIGRLFTTNVLVPPQSYVQFDSAEEVGDYFGTATEEYLRAAFYFSWVSKNITQAQRISFARWVDVAQAGVIYGAKADYTLGSFTGVTTGRLNLTIGTHQHELTGIDLSSDASLAAVAATVQVAIRAYSTGSTDWTAAVVAYDTTNKRFTLTGGVAGPEIMAIAAASTGTDVGVLLGWLNASAIIGQGSAVESLTDCLTDSAEQSNNFGSFLFLSTLTTDQITEVATWNDGQNVLFQYMVPVTASNASAISAAIDDLAGNAMTLAPVATEYPEQIPMMILAATDYTAKNSVVNYMFTEFALTPSVTTNADANTYDGLHVNYYGQTQSAGQFISFYQRGILTGGATAPVDQNVYGNEQWLKDAAGTAIINLLLALPQVAANTTGKAQLTTVLQNVIDLGLNNGTISVGKPLTVDQKLFITNITGSNTAWQQVQNNGYWIGVTLQTYLAPDDRLEWEAVYTLVYSKDDVIRKVQGRHVLI